MLALSLSTGLFSKRKEDPGEKRKKAVYVTYRFCRTTHQYNYVWIHQTPTDFPIVVLGTQNDLCNPRHRQLEIKHWYISFLQKQVTNKYLNEAKKKFAEGDDDPKSGGLALMRAYRGLPKNSALIKFLSEPGVRVKLQKSENYYLADQQKEMPKVDEELYFHIDEKNNSVDLTDRGIQAITKAGEDADFFLIPNIFIEKCIRFQ